jgi:hypothetical protein
MGKRLYNEMNYSCRLGITAADGKGKVRIWQYRDFAFNDSDPEKMTATTSTYDNYYSIGTDDDPYLEEGLIKM